VIQAQHDDPFGDVRNQIAQGLAVAATVGEAAARWAAVGIQKRAADAEGQAGAKNATCAADRLANSGQERQDRKLIDKGPTDWLSRASMEATVRLWRTATIYATSRRR
jgi:hypothetical protein